MFSHSRGYTYLLTIVDRFTRWPEAIPLSEISTLTCARALLANWIFCFGMPLHITTDRGPQFTSQLWSDLGELLGTKLHRTTAYHPQANGLVERFHRQLKASLKVLLHSPNWSDGLPWVLLGIRSTPKEDLETCPAELVYGFPLTLPGDFIARSSEPTVAQHLKLLREKCKL